VPATSEITEEQRLTGGALEEESPMPDRPMGAEEWGVTAAEQASDEPIADRVRREQRNVATREPRSGAAVVDPTPVDDDEPDMVGEIDSDRDDVLSPEEQAMRVEKDPPGLSNAPDPGYVED
jgi:hypothetical protein